MGTTIFKSFPELKSVKDRIYFMYAGPVMTLGSIVYRSAECVVNEINYAVNNKKDIIIFYNISEPLTFDSLKKIHTCAALLPTIPKLYYITGSINGSDVYASLSRKHSWSQCLDVLSVSEFEQITVNEFMKTAPCEYSPKVKSKTFLCFNRVERPHRINLIGKLIKENLLNKGFCSMYSHEYSNRWVNDVRDNRICLIEPEVADIIVKNKNIFPLELTGDKINRNNPIYILDQDKKLFDESYYSLVTETLYYKHDTHTNMCYSIFFSEKIFKPIIMKHPFILVSTPHALKWLKRLGYKTFSPFINEDYDDEINDAVRLEMIVTEVKRLSEFTDEEWLDWQQKVASIVEFNYNVLMNKTDFRITKNLNLGNV